MTRTPALSPKQAANYPRGRSITRNPIARLVIGVAWPDYFKGLD